MKLAKAKSIIMLGVGGTGMRNLAYLLQARGVKVSGVDERAEEIKNWPVLSGVKVIDESAAGERVEEADVIIYSEALDKRHPWLVAANQKGKETLLYNEAVGELAGDSTMIAVAGTHGKSSTTAMLGHILIEANLDPSVLLGADMPSWDNRGARAGAGEYFVVEADEYYDHFLSYRPAHAIVTTIDFDHPDYFKTKEQVDQSFDAFLSGVDDNGWVVAPESVVSEHRQVNWPDNVLKVNNEKLPDMIPSMPGEHMQVNAALAVAMAEKLGVDREDALGAISSFPGLSRRMEELGKYKEMTVVSDYAHHPVEMSKTLIAAQSKYAVEELMDKEDILVIYEAHTLERLKVFYDDIFHALKTAAGVLLVPVFVPKGRPTSTAGEEDETAEADEILDKLYESLKREKEDKDAVQKIGDFEDLDGALKKMASKYNVALAFTAGRLDQKLRDLLSN